MSIHCISPVQKKYFRDQVLLHQALFKITAPVPHDLAGRWKQLVRSNGILRSVSTFTSNVKIPFQEVTDKDQTTVIIIPAEEWDHENIIPQWHGLIATGKISLTIFNNNAGLPAYFGISAPSVWLDSWSLRFLAQQLLTAQALEEEPLQFIQYVEWLESNGRENDDLPAGLELVPEHTNGTFTLQEGKGTPACSSYFAMDLQADRKLLDKLEQVAAQKGLAPIDIWYWAWTNVTNIYLKEGTGSSVYISSGRQFDEFKQIPGPFAKGIYSNFRKEQTSDIFKLKARKERFDVYREYFETSGDSDSCNCCFEYLQLGQFPQAIQGELPLCIDSISCHEPFILSFFAEDTADTTRILLQADKTAISAVSLEWVGYTLLAYVTDFISGSTPAKSLLPDIFLKGPVVPIDFIPVTTLFISAAGHYADNIALQWNEGSITYGKLYRQSRQLAEVLMVQYGIKPGDRVLINMSRTERLLEVIWAVMFTGATYIPVDKQYPEARVQYIMQQSEAKMAIAENAALLFDQAACIKITRELPVWQPDQPVYILYTSGTTGRPKGCVITMSNLLHYTNWAGEYYFANKPSGMMPLFTPIAFDLTVTSFFCTLLRGAALYICDEEGIVAAHLKLSFRSADSIKLTPSHIRMLPYLDIKNTSINTCIVGGEALTRNDVAILRSLNPSMKIYNEYGPTECTVGCIVWDVPESFNDIQIGKPINNTSAYILNQQMELCTPGIEGEICIGGKTTGAGYFRDTAKTAERFVNGLYKTGDKGYWLPDGNICCTGRNDDMIKIRGYRIEPGEIAAVITSIAGVGDAFVMLRNNELAGYYTGEAKLSDTIKAALKKQLPAYMHPANIIAMNQFPVNANGKLDVAALPSPEEIKVAVAPRTPHERMLAGVWEIVLQRSPVGIHDHFLGIGGDSIKAIQVVARMREKGWTLQVGDILKYPTISELVSYLKETDHIREDDMAKGGEIPLTPLQIKFFMDNDADLHYYNQSILLTASERVDAAKLKAVITALWQSHAALRTVFTLSGNQRIQQILPAATAHEGCFIEQQETDLEEQTQYWQQQFNLENGPLFRCLLLHGKEHDLIFLIAHHLIIDGVSWRIILEQLGSMYAQPAPENRTSFASYLKWSEALRKKADALTVTEMSYWMNMELAAEKEWQSFGPVQRVFGQYDHLNAGLSAEKTKQLLTLPLHTMKVSVQEILLAALSGVLYNWSGRDETTFYLESHGRNSTEDAASYAETIGWFTMKYPVILPCSPDTDIRKSIQQTIAALEKTPGNGEGYLCQRYLGGLNTGKVEPLFTFNYLGQLDDSRDGQFRIHPLSGSLQNVGDNIYMPSAAFFTLIVTGGTLQVNISYHRELLLKDSARQLLQNYISSLGKFIDELAENDGTFKKKISGTEDLGLNEKELEEILNSI